ncbi:hypothetical protein LguiB_032326 [Lonicera macranthoides]
MGGKENHDGRRKGEQKLQDLSISEPKLDSSQIINFQFKLGFSDAYNNFNNKLWIFWNEDIQCLVESLIVVKRWSQDGVVLDGLGLHQLLDLLNGAACQFLHPLATQHYSSVFFFLVSQGIHRSTAETNPFADCRHLKGWNSWPRDLRLLHAQGGDRTPDPWLREEEPLPLHHTPWPGIRFTPAEKRVSPGSHTIGQTRFVIFRNGFTSAEKRVSPGAHTVGQARFVIFRNGFTSEEKRVSPSAHTVGQAYFVTFRNDKEAILRIEESSLSSKFLRTDNFKGHQERIVNLTARHSLSRYFFEDVNIDKAFSMSLKVLCPTSDHNNDVAALDELNLNKFKKA